MERKVRWMTDVSVRGKRESVQGRRDGRWRREGPEPMMLHGVNQRKPWIRLRTLDSMLTLDTERVDSLIAGPFCA